MEIVSLCVCVSVCANLYDLCHSCQPSLAHVTHAENMQRACMDHAYCDAHKQTVKVRGGAGPRAGLHQR